jgi:predicted  nucleic acid-binding Zn ribbon protein
VSADLVPKVSALAAALGITIDLPFWDEEEQECTEIREESASVLEEDVEVSQSKAKTKLPMVCWYCDDTFGSLAELQKHLPVHQDKHVKKKNRKCPQCGQVRVNIMTLEGC